MSRSTRNRSGSQNQVGFLIGVVGCVEYYGMYSPRFAKDAQAGNLKTVCLQLKLQD